MCSGKSKKEIKMEKFKGTKGKAKLFNECFKNEYNFYVQPVSINGNDSILFANAYGNTKEEVQANAKLIASAPEMLEMLNETFILTDKLTMPTEFEISLLRNKLFKLILKITE